MPELDTRTDIDIAVIGAGPAGAMVALALARLDYRVRVLAVARGFDACEGVSERVLKALADAGLDAASEVLPAPSPRSVNWNGEQRDANSERLVLRREFDAALVCDLQRAGLAPLPWRVRGITPLADGRVLLRAGEGELLARCVVDARGRAAPRASGQRLRGPETVALLQRWQGDPGTAASQILSLDEGWAWMARTAHGQCFTQLTLAVDNPAIPGRAQLGQFLRARLGELPQLQQFLGQAQPCAQALARSSTAVLQAPMYGSGVLRVGDAAMAVDPLSGNGIFQALSSAAVAPAVINTLLRDPDRTDLALRFYDERVRHIFERFARIGRDFYRSETQWRDTAFWQQRSHWPDDEPAHADGAGQFIGLAPRPVVENGFIREREVALVSDQPLGVWCVAGIELAPLLRELPPPGSDRAQLLRQRISAAAAGDPGRVHAVSAWLRSYGLLADPLSAAITAGT